MEEWLPFSRDIFHVKMLLFLVLTTLICLLVVDCCQLILIKNISDKSQNEINLELTPDFDDDHFRKQRNGIYL